LAASCWKKGPEAHSETVPAAAHTPEPGMPGARIAAAPDRPAGVAEAADMPGVAEVPGTPAPEVNMVDPVKMAEPVEGEEAARGGVVAPRQSLATAPRQPNTAGTLCKRAELPPCTSDIST